MTEPPTLDAAALTEWIALSEAILRGLVHALNNRLTALSAYAELAAMGDEEFAAGRVVPGELERLQATAVLFRLLASEAGTPEAMELGPVLEDARALHAHHAVLRAVQCLVTRHDANLPVRAPKWALTRLILALMETGKRAAGEAGRDSTTLAVTGDTSWVVLHVDGGTVSPYAAAMARLCGAVEPSDAERGMVRLPTLLELRRRERAAREAAGS